MARKFDSSFPEGGRMVKPTFRWMAAVTIVANLIVAGPGAALAGQQAGPNDPANHYQTTTPIKHVIVIFQENESFDHYFGTYPDAANPPGETEFHALPHSGAVNGLSYGLLTHNPNGPSAQPFRLDPSQNYTCDQTHYYTPEQQAFDAGLMDKFPQFTGSACSGGTYPSLASYGTGVVMGYYDGNTVTALWNYAQYFALVRRLHFLRPRVDDWEEHRRFA
jgi:phospholipase C